MKYLGRAFIKRIEEKYKTLDEIEQGGITYLNISFDKIFNMSNFVITSLRELINKISKDKITKVPNENVSSLTQKMNDVCESLSESKALPHENPVHILTGLTWCGVSEFVFPFELMINTKCVRQM